jgi:hypothetical protein
MTRDNYPSCPSLEKASAVERGLSLDDAELTRRHFSFWRCRDWMKAGGLLEETRHFQGLHSVTTNNIVVMPHSTFKMWGRYEAENDNYRLISFFISTVSCS